MSNYYFVGCILPTLSFEVEPEINFIELDTLLRDNLSQKDYEKTVSIRRFFDILNLRATWLNESIDPRGEMNVNDIEEAVITHAGLPSYIFDFLARYQSLEERLENFPLLLAKFFKEAQQNKDHFLRTYFKFERELRLVTSGFRAKKLGRDLAIEMRYEDPEEEIINALVSQKDIKVFEPPEGFEELKIFFEKYSDDPLLLQKALDEYRFNFIDQLVDMSDAFSIERILAYMAQLIIVEKWFELDKAKGMKIVDIIVKEG